MIIAPYSGGKGGVGKTTILTYLSLLLSSKFKVLIIDTSPDYGISYMLLKYPDPPYFKDVVRGDLSIRESISRYKFTLEDISYDFYMIPNKGSIRCNLSDNVLKQIKDVSREYDFIVIDIPSWQRGDIRYHRLTLISNVLLIVTTPLVNHEPEMLNIENDYLKRKKIILYVINCPVPIPSKVIKNTSRLVNNGNDVYIFPYDPAVALSVVFFEKSLKAISRDFQKPLLSLALNLVRWKYEYT